MEIFGIGPLEFLLIIVIMLIVLGPKDMVKTGQRLGRFIRQVIKSPAWSSMMNTTREIRELPTKLVRESGLEEDMAEINKMRESLQFRDLPGKMLQDLSMQEEIAQLKKDATIDLNASPAEPEVKPEPTSEESDTTQPEAYQENQGINPQQGE